MKRVIFDDNSEVVNDWIGKIPNQWQVKRLKFVSNFISGYSFKADEFTDNGIPVIRIGDIKERIDLVDCKYWDELEFESLKAFEVKKDDILVALTGATIGKSTLYDIESPALLNQRCAILRPQKIIENIFLKHFIKTDIFREYINLECNGGAQGNIGKPEVGNFLMCLPPLPEQQIIAAFLDYKTKQIDDLIAKKEQLLRLLEEKRIALITQAVTKGLDPNVKMKPSGIDWLGDIPVHWDVKRLKRVSTLFGRIGFRGYSTSDIVDEMEGAITLSPSNMFNGKVDLSKCTYLSWEKYEESPEIQIQKNDILLVKTGSTIGKIAFVDKVDYPMTINPQIAVFKDIRCFPKYLFFYLISSILKDQFSLSNSGSTIPTMTQESIGNYAIPLPDEKEQNLIVEFLEGEIKKLESLSDQVKLAIEKLIEYRTALITAAVTGKIDVRDFKPPREE